jgi:hypothetical protein
MTTSALALRGLGFRTRYDVTNLNRGARHVLAIPCTAYLGAAPSHTLQPTPCTRRSSHRREPSQIRWVQPLILEPWSLYYHLDALSSGKSFQ